MKSIAQRFFTFAIVALSINSAKADTIFVSNYFKSRISKITADGQVTTFAAVENRPFGIAFDRNGNLIVASSQFTNVISRVSPAGVVTRYLTLPRAFDATAIAFTRNGSLIVASQGGYSLGRVVGSTVAPDATGFSMPFSLAFDKNDTLFVGDVDDNRISRVAPDRIVTTFASNVYQPFGLAFDRAGNLYASSGSTILKFTPDGERSVFASGLSFPAGLAFDTAGDLFVADFGNDTIKRVTSDGVVHPFVNVEAPQFIAIQPVLDLPTLTTSEPGVVTVNGGINLPYVISQSPDLLNWTPVQTNRITASSTFTVIDEGNATADVRFYRAKLYP